MGNGFHRRFAVGALAALAVAAYFYRWVKSLPTAGAEIERIGTLIRRGAFTFMRREYRTLAVFCGVAALLILTFFPSPIWSGQGAGQNAAMALAYLVGTFLSGVAGYVGISIATITKMGKDGAVVSSEVLVKICSALGCTMDDIVEIIEK